MTYTVARYQNYQDYIDNCTLSDGDYRLLSTGEVIRLPPEDDSNLVWAFELKLLLAAVPGLRKLIRGNDTELEVHPVGDRWMNRKPDVMVLQPEHRELFEVGKYSAVRFGMPAPAFVAELVSPGSESSTNYKRDYIWKRQQYEWWGIPEYWIVDRHRAKVTVLLLIDGIYQETVYTGEMTIRSASFPTLVVTPNNMLN
ncbi:MAG: Uma2 family endonuclease [Cyanobacteria bacterium P01_D01_bin.1]